MGEAERYICPLRWRDIEWQAIRDIERLRRSWEARFVSAKTDRRGRRPNGPSEDAGPYNARGARRAYNALR